MIICSRIPNLSISILTVLVFSVHHIYITYGAPACTTCLFILNLSKNSHLYFAIVSESGCKGKRFYRNRQMFRKFFFGAPACTTCLFILNLSKNSHLYFAIVSESGCKGKRFYRNRQMFRKFFLSAPACTTCLFILNLSKNSHLYFAIVSESGCKGKRFYRNRQMFRKFFLKKFFFRNFHKRRDVHPPHVLSVLAPLAPLR